MKVTDKCNRNSRYWKISASAVFFFCVSIIFNFYDKNKIKNKFFWMKNVNNLTFVMVMRGQIYV